MIWFYDSIYVCHESWMYMILWWYNMTFYYDMWHLMLLTIDNWLLIIFDTSDFIRSSGESGSSDSLIIDNWSLIRWRCDTDTDIVWCSFHVSLTINGWQLTDTDTDTNTWHWHPLMMMDDGWWMMDDWWCGWTRTVEEWSEKGLERIDRSHVVVL